MSLCVANACRSHAQDLSLSRSQSPMVSRHLHLLTSSTNQKGLQCSCGPAIYQYSFYWVMGKVLGSKHPQLGRSGLSNSLLRGCFSRQVDTWDVLEHAPEMEGCEATCNWNCHKAASNHGPARCSPKTVNVPCLSLEPSVQQLKRLLDASKVSCWQVALWPHKLCLNAALGSKRFLWPWLNHPWLQIALRSVGTQPCTTSMGRTVKALASGAWAQIFAGSGQGRLSLLFSSLKNTQMHSSFHSPTCNLPLRTSLRVCRRLHNF